MQKIEMTAIAILAAIPMAATAGEYQAEPTSIVFGEPGEVTFDASGSKAAFPAAAEPRFFSTWEDFGKAAVEELNAVPVEDAGKVTIELRWSIIGTPFMLDPDPDVIDAVPVGDPLAAYFGGTSESIVVDGSQYCLSARCYNRLNLLQVGSTTANTTSVSILPMAASSLTAQAKDTDTVCDAKDPSRCITGTSEWFINYFFSYYSAKVKSNGAGKFRRYCYRCWLLFTCCSNSHTPDAMYVNGRAVACRVNDWRPHVTPLVRSSTNVDSVAAGATSWSLFGDSVGSGLQYTEAEHYMEDAIGALTTKTAAGHDPGEQCPVLH